MKKKVLLLLCIMTVAVVGCGDGASNQESKEVVVTVAPTEAPEPTAEPTEIPEPTEAPEPDKSEEFEEITKRINELSPKYDAAIEKAQAYFDNLDTATDEAMAELDKEKEELRKELEEIEKDFDEANGSEDLDLTIIMNELRNKDADFSIKKAEIRTEQLKERWGIEDTES